MCALLLSDTALPAAFATQTGEGPVEGVFSADMDAESTDTTVDGVLSAVQTAEEASTEQIQNLNVEVQATTTASKSDAVYVMIDGKKYTPRVIRTATNDLSPTYSELPVHYYNGDSFTFKFSMDDSIDFDSLRRISLGMRMRPRSSTLLTMPVACICGLLFKAFLKLKNGVVLFESHP